MTKIRKMASPHERARRAARKHALMDASPDQIEAWIDENVTDLRSAKRVLTWLTILVTESGTSERRRGPTPKRPASEKK